MKIRFFGEIDINKDYYETTIHLKDRYPIRFEFRRGNRKKRLDIRV